MNVRERAMNTGRMAVILAITAMVSVGFTANSFGQTFTTDKAQYFEGENIVFSWTGQSGTATDWIRIYTITDPYEKEGGANMGRSYTDGTPNGSYTALASAWSFPTGDYEAWFYPEDLNETSGPAANFSIIRGPVPLAKMLLPAEDVFIPGGMAYEFSVVYTDDVLIDVASIGIDDVTVVGPGVPLTITSAVTTPTVDADTITVIYTVTPPGGTWDYADSYSSYTIAQVADQVQDKAVPPNSAVAKTFDIFSVVIAPAYAEFITPVEVTAVSETVAAPAVNLINSSGLTENSARGLHDSNNLANTMWLSGAGIVADAELVFDLGAVYDLNSVFIWQLNQNWNGGGWTTDGVDRMDMLVSADNVTFTPVGDPVILSVGTGAPGLPAQVRPLVASNVRYVKFDIKTALGGNSEQVVGLSEVRFGTALAEAPIGRITEPAPDVSPQIGQTDYVITVAYSDLVNIDVSTIDINDIVISSIYGNLNVESVIMTSDVNAPFVLATYTFTALGGIWDLSDVGDYDITLVAGEVKDIDGTGVAETALDSFEVLLPLGASAASVYEPFDYTIGDNINGKEGGGKGFIAPWESTISHGKIYWLNDGRSFPGLPTLGSALTRGGSAGRAQANRLLTEEARADLTADNKTVWFSVLFQESADNRGAMFLFASQPLKHTDLYTFENPGVGFGFSINSPNDGTISACAFDTTTEATYEVGTGFIPDPPTATNLMVGKINWKPSGTPDQFFLFNVTDLENEPAEETAIASITSLDLDQSLLDRVSICDGTVSIFDEIRFGKTFDSVMGSAGLPQLGISPSDLDFGEVPSNAGIQTKELTISNSGWVGTDLSLLIGPVVLPGPIFSDVFTVQSVVRSSDPQPVALVGTVPREVYYPSNLGTDDTIVVTIAFDPSKTPVGNEQIYVNSTYTHIYGTQGSPIQNPPPSGLDLAIEDDTGASFTDNITNAVTSLTISGVAVDAVTVNLLIDGTLAVSGTVAEFAAGLDINLSEGTHVITATAIDFAQVQTAPSEPLTIIVDTTAPEVLSITPSTPGPTMDVTKVTFDVLFDGDVLGFDALEDVTLTLVANATNTAYSVVTVDDAYTVTVSGLAGEGTLSVAVNEGAVQDVAGNLNVAFAPSEPVIIGTGVPLYTLAVDHENGTVMNVPAGTTFIENTVVALTPVPDDTFRFLNWAGSDVPVGSGTEVPLLITMDANKEITAVFVPDTPTYVLTLTADSNGTATSSPPSTFGSYEENTIVTLTATSNTGYGFAGWTGTDVPVGSEQDNPLVITMDAAKSITATYEILTYALDAQAGHGGSVATDPLGTIQDHGTTVTVTATPNAHFHFVAWTGPDAPAGAENINPATFVITTETMLTATFAVDMYTLATFAENGTVITDPPGVAHGYGTAVSLLATSVDGYRFTEWTGGATGSDNPMVISMDADTTVTANFEEIPIYALVVDAGAGSATQDPLGTEFDDGTTITVEATPPVGYSFDVWTGAPAGLESDNPIMLNIAANTTLTATYRLNTHAVNAMVVGSGTVAKMPADVPHTHGTTVSLVATPDAHNHFTGWTGVPKGQELENPVVLSVTSNLDVTAIFAIDQHTLTVTAGNGGTVATTPTAVTYAYGTLVTVTAMPDENFAFAGWTGDVPAGQETANPITIFVNTDKAVNATFYALPDPADYKVTYKNCIVDVDDDGNFTLSGTSAKSSLKIALLKKPPKSMEPKAGKFFYLSGFRVIPELTIAGDFGAFSSDVEIWTLVATGNMKSITTKIANIAWIEAASIASIKMTATPDYAGAGKTATTSIMTSGAGKMKASILGIVVENFVIDSQVVKSLSVASKAFKTPAKAKTYALGGIGALSRVVAQAAGDENIPLADDSQVSAPTLTSISAKGAPVTPDTIFAGLSKITVQGGLFKVASGAATVDADLVVRRLISTTPMKSITGKAKKGPAGMVGGVIGSLADPMLMRIQVGGDIKALSGQDIAAILWAGFTGEMPMYSGLIKKVTAKGVLAGEAHVSAEPKVKAVDATAFTVFTSAQ